MHEPLALADFKSVCGPVIVSSCPKFGESCINRCCSPSVDHPVPASVAAARQICTPLRRLLFGHREDLTPDLTAFSTKTPASHDFRLTIMPHHDIKAMCNLMRLASFGNGLPGSRYVVRVYNLLFGCLQDVRPRKHRLKGGRAQQLSITRLC